MRATQAIEAGFADPVDEANAVFRHLLDAQSHPGRIVTLASPERVPRGGLGRAAIGVALALADFETPVWLDEAAAPAAAHLRFHCNCPVATAPADATFVFVADPAAMPALDALALGTDAYPDQGATLVIEVASLDGDGTLVLKGPGINGETRLGVVGLPAGFWAARAALAPLFPRGIDLLLSAGDQVVALPRTTHVREA